MSDLCDLWVIEMRDPDPESCTHEWEPYFVQEGLVKSWVEEQELPAVKERFPRLELRVEKYEPARALEEENAELKRLLGEARMHIDGCFGGLITRIDKLLRCDKMPGCTFQIGHADACGFPPAFPPTAALKEKL